MTQEFDFNPLLDLVDIKPRPVPGILWLTNRMEPPENDPRNDWLYPGIMALKDIANEKRIKKAACIGTGQGIDAIIISHLFHPEKLYVTDLVKELLPQAQKNIEHNVPPQYRPREIIYLSGRDCEPLPEPVDLITFSPPPLMVYERNDLDNGITRTTITEAEQYLAYSSGPDDIKLKWSTIPQYAFLLSARKKLTPHGSVLTLYTGRIPFAAIETAFRDAGFSVAPRYQIIKYQTDPQFLKEYALYEKEHLKKGEMFDFYDFEKTQLILTSHGIGIPCIVSGYTDGSLKELIKDAKIGAVKAYKSFQEGKNVVHIGYALEGLLDNE